MANAFDEKILGERQKIALAQKLRESGQEIPQGRMVGDRFVGASWTQGLAQALKQGLGAYDESQAENKIKELEGERTKGSIEALGSMGLQATPEMLKQAGTPEQTPSLFKRAGALLSGEDQPQTIPAQPYQQNVAQNVTPDQFDAGALKLMGYDPTMAAGAIGLSSARAARDVAAAEKAYRHKQDADTAAAKVEAARIQREFLTGEHELTRAATAANHQAEAPVAILREGKPILVPRSEAIGQTPYYASSDKQNALKAIPVGALKAYSGNNASLSAIDRAAQLSLENPNSTGLSFGINNKANQMLDPTGVATRAAISDIGSQKIHDRSGASVTISESPRLAPFIPTETDDAKTIQTKLKNLALNLNDMQTSLYEAHPPELYTQQQLVQHIPKILGGEESTGGLPSANALQAEIDKRNKDKGAPK